MSGEKLDGCGGDRVVPAKETPLEPSEVAEMASQRKRARVSPERIALMMDPTQYLLFRFSLAYSLRPMLVAYTAPLDIRLKTKRVLVINAVSSLVNQLTLIDQDAKSLLETICREAYGRSCTMLTSLELIDLPIHMLRNGASLDIVVETMTFLYSFLLYVLGFVGPETALSALPREEELVVR